MNDLLPFVIGGLATGAVYGLAGTGVVLTYRTSGIFNFAHGALATISAYLFYWLHFQEGIDWEISFVLSVVVLGPLLGLAMEGIARKLSVQQTSMQIVGTIGIILLVQGLATIKFGPNTLPVPPYLPDGAKSVAIFGANVTYNQLITTAVGVVCAAALYILLRFSRTGTAMRAVVDNPELLAMRDTRPESVRRLAWIIGSTFACLAGVLIVPLIGADPIALTYLIIQAFGAAAIGAFANLPMTFVGGLVIGVASSISTKYVLSVSWLNGIPSSLPFIILLVVLIVLPKRKLISRTLSEARPRLQYRAAGRLHLSTGVLVLVVLAIIPAVVGLQLTFFTVGLTQAILILSLGLLVRTAGQVSLCQVAFAAIGAVAFSEFRLATGLPWLLALVLACLITVPIGALVAIPAIRLSGIYLALATLGFGITVERLAYPLSFMFGVNGQGRTIPRPSIATGGAAYYYLVLGFLVLVALFMEFVHRGRLGRLLRAMSDSSLALPAVGLGTNATRVIVFGMSSFIAALAGVLYGGAVFNASSTDIYYSSFTSLTLLAVLALAPFAEPWYAIFAIIAAVIPGYLSSANTTYWLNVIFGVSAVAVAMQGGTASMPASLRRFFDRLGGGAVAPAWLKSASQDPPRTKLAEGAGLSVQDLTVRFGGLVAVDNVSFEVPPGSIVGLIGPNGAGKTVTFNACSGLARAAAGRIRFGGAEIGTLTPARRARRGLGRTFQRPELCDSLTVFDNVALGREAGIAGMHVLSQIVATPGEQREIHQYARASIERCGLGDIARTQAGLLTTGQRRLVELARCLTGGFDLLMLDEPSAGLDRDETARFSEVLLAVTSERGCGVLIVEHDMSLVMSICDYIYVLDSGRLIAQGTPAAIGVDPAVRAAYLGTEVLPGTPELSRAGGARITAAPQGRQAETAETTAAPESPALEVRALSGGYGEVEVLSEVSLVVPRNSVTALLGANGAGKTTLLRTISGFLPPSAGRVLISGEEATRESPVGRVRRGLCHIPEGRGVFRSLTVRENLAMFGLKGHEEEAYTLAAEAFPILGARMKQVVGTMSGGQQQMLAMAATYIRRPDLILIDEASLGLAPIIVDEIFAFLADVAARGAALLLVDQYVTRVLALADRAYVLQRGRIVYSGDAVSLSDAEIFAHYMGSEQSA